jgi:DnaJ-class molecular chaperone
MTMTKHEERRQVDCPCCDGKGWHQITKDYSSDCYECDGDGKVACCDECGGDGDGVRQWTLCGKCDGEGLVLPDGGCKGRVEYARERTG